MVHDYHARQYTTMYESTRGLLDFMDANYRELLEEIKTVGEMSDKAESKMKKAVEDFKKGFSAS